MLYCYLFLYDITMVPSNSKICVGATIVQIFFKVLSFEALLNHDVDKNDICYVVIK